MLFALCAVAKLATVKNGKNKLFTLGIHGEKIDTMYSETYGENFGNGIKMNNDDAENAKTYTSDAKKIKIDSSGKLMVRVLNENDVVQSMPLEEYVTGCVLGEMPLSFEAQALMAQCVAVRSFTVNRLLSESKRHKNADVCTNPACCQNYISPKEKNLSEEYAKKLYDAVNATRSVIAVYGGAPIEAAYHASSGYKTEDSKDVWGGSVPYLKSVKSPDGEAEICTEKYTFTYERFSSLLSDECGKSVSCGSFGKGVEYDCDEYSLARKISSSSTVLDKNRLKKALGLVTKNFKIDFGKDLVTVTCYGSGHGVGMSQHGANLLAKQGKSYSDIIKYYYSGVSLAFLT